MFETDISSPIPTELDLFNDKVCICGCLVEEHLNKKGNCYGLQFNGTVYTACRCSLVKIKEFFITAVISYADTDKKAA